MTTALRIAGALGIGALFALPALAIKRWHNDKHPVMHWPCDRCHAEFSDRNPERLDQAIREHRLAHRNIKETA